MTNSTGTPAVPAPRKLLVICHGFPPYYGGAEHVAFYLAREAAAAGWNVSTLTSDIGGRLPARELMEGVQVLRLRSPKRKWTRHNVLELAAFQWHAIRQMRRWQSLLTPDYALAHFSVPAGEVARRLKQHTGVPYAVVLHGSDVPGYQPGRFGWIYPLLRPYVRRVWREARAVIAVSGGLRDLALSVWPEGRIHVIENGVDTQRFRPAEAGAGTGPLRLISTAQLIERKGLHHLLEALALLTPQERASLRLDVYGTGPWAGFLQERTHRLGVDEIACFRGLVSPEQLAEILRTADVFVLPSLQEGLPLALLEAMASGLAVLATRVGGIPSVIQHGENGWLVPPADPAALAEALRILVAQPNLRRRLGAAARHTAEAHAWAAVWRRYEALLWPAATG